jgi:transcriptional regulator with XRE-family HTH domain
MPSTRSQPARRPARATFSDELRDCIERDPRAPHAIARDAGVSAASLSRFLAGKRGLTSDTIDALAAELGIHLGAPTRARGRPRKEAGSTPIISVTSERTEMTEHNDEGRVY